MIAKTGFILLVMLFGALMFMAGALAPPGVEQTLTGAANQLASYLPWIKKAGTGLAPGKTGAGTGATASASTAPHAAAGQPAPVAASSLLIPTTLPDTGLYALKAGQFARDDAAAALYAKIQATQLPVQKVLNVQDQSGALWTVVAVGPYSSLDAARSANSVVAAQLGLIGPLPLILLPAPAKS